MKSTEIYLASIASQVHELQHLDLNSPGDRIRAQRQSLEILRKIACYRGLIKNAAELDQWKVMNGA